MILLECPYCLNRWECPEHGTIPPCPYCNVPGELTTSNLSSTIVGIDAELSLERASSILPKALELLRMLTPAEWELAHTMAVRERMHTMDTALLRDARLLSMRMGGEWGVHG